MTTQPATRPQGNAILDVVDQCRLVYALWEGREASRRTGGQAKKTASEQTMEADADKAFEQARNDLLDLYLEAVELGLTDAVLFPILDRNLPAVVAGEMDVKEKTCTP